MRKEKGPNIALLEAWSNIDPIERVIECVDFSSSLFHRKFDKGGKLGVDFLGVKSIAVRGMPGIILLLSEHDRRKAHKNIGQGEGKNPITQDIEYTVPGEASFEEARKTLASDQERHAFFFKWAIHNGQLNQRMLTEIFDAQRGSMGLVVRGYHAAPGSLVASSPATIQDFVETEYILKPAFNLGDAMLEKLRICPTCQRIFLSKSTLANFCSSKCRSIAFRNKNKL